VNAAPRSKAFFFEKKKQKTFDYFGFGLSGERGPKFVKVFWFFFSKKNCFLSSPDCPAATHPGQSRPCWKHVTMYSTDNGHQ